METLRYTRVLKRQLCTLYTCTQVVVCYILYNCICIIIYTQYTTCDASTLMCLLCKCHAYYFLMNWVSTQQKTRIMRNNFSLRPCIMYNVQCSSVGRTRKLSVVGSNPTQGSSSSFQMSHTLLRNAKAHTILYYDSPQIISPYSEIGRRVCGNFNLSCIVVCTA